MSVAELKRTVDEATPEERKFLVAYAKLKAREGDPEVGKQLADAHKRIEAGSFASLEQLISRDNQLRQAGR